MGKFLDEKQTLLKQLQLLFCKEIVACVAFSLTFQAEVSQNVSNHAAELYTVYKNIFL